MPVRTRGGGDVREGHRGAARGAELLEAECARGHVEVGGNGDLHLPREVLRLGRDVFWRAGQESLHDNAHDEGHVACCEKVPVQYGKMWWPRRGIELSSDSGGGGFRHRETRKGRVEGGNGNEAEQNSRVRTPRTATMCRMMIRSRCGRSEPTTPTRACSYSCLRTGSSLRAW